MPVRAGKALALCPLTEPFEFSTPDRCLPDCLKRLPSAVEATVVE